MKKEKEVADDVPVEDSNRIAKLRQFPVLAGLRVIDTMLDLLWRVRDRLQTPTDDAEQADDRRPKPPPDSGDAAVPASGVTPKTGRLVVFLSLVAVLIAGCIAGAVFSYRMLSAAMDSNTRTMEILGDELAQMKRLESLNLKQIDKDRQTIRDYQKDIDQYLKDIEDFKVEAEDLRSQSELLNRRLSAAGIVQQDPPSLSSRAKPSASTSGKPGKPGAGLPAKSATPQKTGTCAMDQAMSAVDLERCIKGFNLK